MTLVALIIAWLLGIIIADIFHLPFFQSLVVGMIAVLVAAVVWRWQPFRLVVLIVCALAFGAARLASAQAAAETNTVREFNDGSDVVLLAEISADPQRTEEGQRFIVQALAIQQNNKRIPVAGQVLVRVPPYPERRYGDRVMVYGTLTTPREAERNGEFDYRAYLARKQIFSLMKPTAVKLVSPNNGSAFLSKLLELRDTARRVLLREFPEPQSSLAVGILLGLQSSIPPDVYSTFSQTGTSHILVISGWNISIIGMALYALAARMGLSQRAAFWPILITIWIYTLFVGATPTVFRAAVMGSIVIIGKRLDRQSEVWHTLFAACWLMTVQDPQVLWDLGFQLSALATASLFAFGKGVEAQLQKTFLRAGWLDWAREALTATLAAQILALPLILYQFGNLSIIAPLANVVLLPVVPYAMLFASVALVAGLIWLPLGQWLALPAYATLTWLTEGARLFAGMPWAATQIPPFPLGWLLGYYAVVIGVWLGLPHWREWHTGSVAAPEAIHAAAAE